MKTICISISKEVEEDDLKNLFSELNKVLEDGGWMLDDLQIL